MKQILWACTFFGLISCGYQQDDAVIDKVDDSIQWTTLNDSTKQRVVYHPNGEVRSTEYFVNNIIHGEFKSYRSDGTLIQTRTYVNGKIFGNLTNHDSKGRLTSYNFIGQECLDCDSTDAGTYFMLEYDTLGNEVSYFGNPIIESELSRKRAAVNDTLELSLRLAVPPNQMTDCQVYVIENEERHRFASFEKNNEEETLRFVFSTPGEREMLIEYYHGYPSKDSLSLYTGLIDDIVITEK